MGCRLSSDKGDSPFLEKYTPGETLAEGHFGQLRVCKRRKGGAEYAVRSLATASVKHKIKANRQGNVLRLLGKHPHLVEFIDHFDEVNVNHLVLERCPCSLIEKMNESEDGRYHDGELLDTFRQLLLGLEHCHSKSVAHRDVKASKMLVGADGKIKLSDFSNAIVVPSEGISGLVGTVEFMAPEMLEGKMYGCKADIWSCGATAYFLFYGEHPNQTGEKPKPSSPKKASIDSDTPKSQVNVMRAIRSNRKRPTFVSSRRGNGGPEPSIFARNFIDSLLQMGNKRPTATEALITIEEAISGVQQQRASSTESSDNKDSEQFYVVSNLSSEWTEIASTMSPCSAQARDTQGLDLDEKSSGVSTSLLSGQSCTVSSESSPSKVGSEMNPFQLPPLHETSDKMIQAL